MVSDSRKPYDSVFFFHVPAGQLVGLRDTNHFRDPGERFEIAAIHFALIAGDADGGALRSRKRMSAEAQLFNVFTDRLDFLLRSLSLHDNQHNRTPRIISLTAGAAKGNCPDVRESASDEVPHGCVL